MKDIKIKKGTSVYETISVYLENKFGSENVTEKQVISIAKATFSYLNQTQKISVKDWKKSVVLSEVQKQSLVDAVDHVVISPKTPWKPNLNLPESPIQKLLFNVMQGNVPPVKETLKNKAMIAAVVWKKNPELLKEGRELLSHIFNDMMGDISKLSDKESFHMETIIGDLLSLYPFLDPQLSEEVNIPVRIQDKWHLVPYEVEIIKLTPKWMGSPLVAIGLAPKEKEEGIPPLLLFKGTTYPTDSGFGLSLITDINPGASVGDYAFRAGKKKIAAWLDANAGEDKAVVYGKSLGGAQSWRTAMNFPDKVAKVMAYGAPGLSRHDQKKWSKIVKEKNLDYPEVNMFCQTGDPAPFFNRAVKKGFNYYEVASGRSRKGVAAHADMYSTHETSSIIRMSESKVASKWRRIGLTVSRVFLSIFVFPFIILGHAIQTAVKKTGRLIDKHVIKKST